MGYSDAEVEPLAQRLVQQLPGLDVRLARVWIKSESGANGNPLGVTHVENGVSKLSTYATREQGIDAAASLVRSSGNYAGVRSAFAGGNLRQQALALIASPWNARNSPYYTRVFTAAGLLGSGGATTTGDPKLLAALKQAGISTDPAHVLTTAEQVKLTRILYPLSRSPNLVTARTVGDFLKMTTVGEQAGTAVGEAAAAVGALNPLPGIAESLVQVSTYLAALFLVGLGVFLYSKGGRGQEVPVAYPAS